MLLLYIFVIPLLVIFALLFILKNKSGTNKKTTSVNDLNTNNAALKDFEQFYWFQEEQEREKEDTSSIPSFFTPFLKFCLVFCAVFATIYYLNQ